MSFTIGGFTGFGYNGDPATGQIIPGAAISGESPRVAFRYDRATRTYTLVTLDLVSQEDRFVLFSTPDNATNPAHTDAKFLGYTGTTFGQNATGVLRLYRSASTNPELKLTYSGLGHLARSAPLGHLNFGDFWFGYGVETRAEDIPITGTAAYSGVIYGFAVDPIAGNQYVIEGTASLTLNFVSQKASGTFNMTLVADDGSRIAVGAASFPDSTIGSMDGVPFPFGGTLTGSSVPFGSVEARLFGPRAVEIAGHFANEITVASGSGKINAHGAFAVVKD